MKRDFELIKQILLKIEDRETTSPILDLEIDGYDQNLVNYQIYLLDQADLIQAEIVRVGANEIHDPVIYEMTWNGHEFLDAARNETIWNKTKDLIKEHGGSVPFEVLQSLLKQVALSLIT